MAFNRKLHRNQRGAALVEFAITFMIFFTFILAIIEFAMLVFDASRLNEATRAAARYAIVNTPGCNIFHKESGDLDVGACMPNNTRLVCPSSSSVTLTLDEGHCSTFPATTPGCKVVEVMNRAMMRGDTAADPSRSILTDGGEVHITYACTDTGNPELAYPVPLITIEAINIKHPMLMGSIVGNQEGCDSCVTLPNFETSRTGEDMYGG